MFLYSIFSFLFLHSQSSRLSLSSRLSTPLGVYRNLPRRLTHRSLDEYLHHILRPFCRSFIPLGLSRLKSERNIISTYLFDLHFFDHVFLRQFELLPSRCDDIRVQSWAISCYVRLIPCCRSGVSKNALDQHKLLCLVHLYGV